MAGHTLWRQLSGSLSPSGFCGASQPPREASGRHAPAATLAPAQAATAGKWLLAEASALPRPPSRQTCESPDGPTARRPHCRTAQLPSRSVWRASPRLAGVALDVPAASQYLAGRVSSRSVALFLPKGSTRGPSPRPMDVVQLGADPLHLGVRPGHDPVPADLSAGDHPHPTDHLDPWRRERDPASGRWLRFRHHHRPTRGFHQPLCAWRLRDTL